MGVGIMVYSTRPFLRLSIALTCSVTAGTAWQLYRADCRTIEVAERLEGEEEPAELLTPVLWRGHEHELKNAQVIGLDFEDFRLRRTRPFPMHHMLVSRAASPFSSNRDGLQSSAFHML